MKNWKSVLMQFIAVVIGLLIGDYIFSQLGCGQLIDKLKSKKSDTTITIHNGKADTVIKINK